MSAVADQIPSLRILGTNVHAVEIPDTIALMDRWIETERHRCHQVINTGMHGLMEGHRDPEFKAILNSADLFAPDGILLLTIARIRGFLLRKENTGPQLMWDFSQVANQKGYKYYIFGDTEDVLQALHARLKETFPNIQVVGLNSPPFRPLTLEEDESVIAQINEAAPDVLWVGLGTPKQDRWIHERRNRLNVPVAVGVGATFKFYSGRLKRAPAWLGNSGLEWLWRLASEPRRVWRRVFIDAPQFIGLVAMEFSGLKKYS